MTRAGLDRLLDPASIAVVGASTSPEKAGYQALLTLRGFGGRLFPINPGATEILGFKAYPSLAAARDATGVAPDLALLVIPAAGVLEAIRDAVRAGCGGVLIVSGGFAETGGEGATLQEEAAALCREAGLRILGPNTSGFVRPRTRCAASFAPGVEEIPAGPVAVVAQSGGVNLVLAFLVHRLGLGLSLAVGLGNAVDVDAADVLEHLAADADTRAIALHLEGVRDGRRLFDALRRVTPRKPVVAVTPGRADIGAFARSHTGNLIGAWDRRVAALRQSGVVVVDTTDEAADAVAALARGRIAPRPDPGIGILTGQAGPGLLIVDRLKAGGVSVPELAPESLRRIESLLPPLTFRRNPVDTGRPSPAFPAVLRVIADDPNVDAVAVFALHEPAALDPVAVFGPGVSKPVVFATTGLSESIAPTLAALARIGIPAFGSPERLATAARALAEDARLAWRARHAPGSTQTPPVRVMLEPPFDEAKAKALVAAYGIPAPAGVACGTHAEALAALAALRKPVVAKILASEVAHKTEAGGVKVGIDGPAALQAALAELDAIPLSGPRRYLIEEMAPAGVELIAGAVRDPSFGPVVLVGLGGTAAEALQDTAVRLAPLSEDGALEMLDELRGRRLLAGWRGAPPVDRAAVARAIVALGRILLEHPELAEIEINPLRASSGGVLALDALVVAGAR
jgi:acetate---CoA ligase (ADP-forming)